MDRKLLVILYSLWGYAEPSLLVLPTSRLQQLQLQSFASKVLVVLVGGAAGWVELVY